jgi:epoxyqueuosine reductase
MVSIWRLRDLQEAIEGLRRRDLLDEEIDRAYLRPFVFEPPEELPEARSLIAVAYPDPPVRFTFHWRGEPVQAVVPPTYLHAAEKDRRVQAVLEELLAARGRRVTPARVPKKLLAVCSGLAAYGRNNITYVEGMGSYQRLVAFCSDLECQEDEWREPVMMERCQRCEQCARFCPTGAIDPERFLIHAERCITCWNEKPGEVPFPEWLQPAWHNALVGCLHCQRTCPENRAVVDGYQKGAEFSQEETGLLLEGLAAGDLPAALRQKLERWDLLQALDALPRNLRVLLEGREPLVA